MTGQSGNGTGPWPVSLSHWPGGGQTWLGARGRYGELRARDLSARAVATLVARGGYGPARHGAGGPRPLALTGHLEVLADGEVVARVYRHPVQAGRAVQAGAAWAQIAYACGCRQARARQHYRDWAEGQHKLFAGGLGAEPARFGMDEAGYAAAMARAAEGQREPGPAGACGCGCNQPGPCGRQAGQ
jgi:hypothetical protein